MKYVLSVLLLIVVYPFFNKIKAQFPTNIIAAPIKIDIENPSNCFDKPITMAVPNGMAEIEAYRGFYPTTQFYWYYGFVNPDNLSDTTYTFFGNSYDSSITFIPRIAFAPVGSDPVEITKQVFRLIKVHLTDKFTVFKKSKANPIKFSPTAPILNLPSIISTPSCANTATGTIRFIVSKSTDTALYIVRYGTYLEYCNPETNNPPCFNVLTSGFITSNDTITLHGVPAGSYTILLVNKTIDVGICNNVYPAFVPSIAPIQVDSIKLKHVSCFGQANGNIKLFVKNGDASTYRFTINVNDDNGTPIITPNNFLIQYQNDVASFLNLTAGSYTVNFSDTCGITITKKITIKQPPKVVGNVIITPSTCHSPANGAVKILAYYNFVDTAYTKFNYFIYKDSILLKSLENTLDSVLVIDTLIGGNFHVVVTSPNTPNCPGLNQWFTLPVNTLNVLLTQKNSPSCFGYNDASLSIKGIGGSSSYNYLLLNDNTNQILADTLGRFYNLLSGNYTAIIKNKNNTCYDSAILRILVNQPDSIHITLRKKNVQCFNENNGIIKATVIGGNGGYRYAWERKLINGNWSSISNTSDSITGLVPGIYRAKIIDNKNCSGISEAVIVTQPDSLMIDSVIVKDIACINQFGNIKVYSKGGVGNHIQEYRKLPATQFSSFSSNTNLPIGMYLLRIRDTNNCTAYYKDTIAITAPPILVSFNYIQPSFNGYHISCFGADDATLTITATGGNGYNYAGYSYKFDNNPWQASNILTNIPAGIRQIMVKDARGCIITQQVTFLQPNDSLHTTLISKNNINCFGDSTGTITVQATGGVSPYKFSKDGGISYQTTSTFVNLPASVYNIVIKDANNCTGLMYISLINNHNQILANENINNVSCFGGNDASITTATNGGVSPYTYGWLPNNSNTIAINNLTIGAYSLKIIDAIGCNKIFNYSITQPLKLLPEIIANPVCFNATSSFIKIKTFGGTPPFIYSKDAGITWQNDSMFTGLMANNYPISVKDSKQCIYNKIITINTISANPNLNFIASSSQRVGDTITMKEISWIKPDSVSWYFDNRATIIDANSNEPKIKFNSTDSTIGYLIRLKGFYNACTYTRDKYVKILIYDSNAVFTNTLFNRGIKLAELFPNPNNGNFTLNIEFFKIQRAKVYISHLWGLPIGSPLIFEPSLHIVKNFTGVMNGQPPGTYMVRIVSDYDTKYLLFVKSE